MNRHKEYESQDGNVKPDPMRISKASTSFTQNKAEAKSMSPTTGTKNIKVKKLSSNQNVVSDLSNPTDKDEFGIIHKLKSVINSKYQVLEVIGIGSYGTVSKAKCLESGKVVALKIMKNQPKMEYEVIKLLREIQLMSRLNSLNARFFPQD